MLRSFAPALLWATLLVTTAAPALDAVMGKVYRGPDGQLVEVVTLEPRTSGDVLVRVRGTDSELEGIALRCAVKKDTRGADYVTRYHGSDFHLLVQRDGVYEVYLPGTASFRVKFNQEATDKVSTTDVLAAHQRQLASGQLVSLQKKPWPYLEKKYTARATEALAGLQKRCGAAPSFTFDWNSFGDEQMAELDVWAACAPLVTGAERHCAALKDVTVLRCRFGPALGLEREAGTLTLTTTPKGAAEAPAFLDKRLTP